MAPFAPGAAASTSVQVALRIRPTTTQDHTSIPARFQRAVIHAAGPTAVSVDSSAAAPPTTGPVTSPVTASAGPAKKQTFTFDQVHGPESTQYDLFTSTAEPLVARFVEGFNCTVLAYGQTSSGKTHTMTGYDLDKDPSDTTNGMGIIPRSVSLIFARCKKLRAERNGAWNFELSGSFVELYNEDLIDLLSLEDAGGRREVQIREDKDGHIIWGGLREVSVINSSEVMQLIRQGTSIRRTNETDMNAQSSRSHAIFSLTLTQKKWNGTGPPPRSNSPNPAGGRSPSRLARPGSMYTQPTASAVSRVSSPTFGRSSTPTFTSSIGRGISRPASSLGLHPPERRETSEAAVGDWITIVSKFHFVDLAGSERLKRTAAAGERIKEGISINSGLLALGNVISALGDPSRSKTHTATHIPYRDSKLTRLLQDSLGGNAHTLMIACVSPAEWNVGETINTLKYANRARNIKNRAVVNEKEDGWDDVEWLQNTVSRLRKEMKTIKEGGGVLPVTYEAPEHIEGAGKKVLAQLTDLQNNYEDLREKYTERTEELTRLRREIGEKHRGSIGGTLPGTAKYEEIVGPVIEEYEKTIAAMEAELSLNRAALRHTNEMVEEKEEELAVITERHAATELYVEDLRARVAKLSERELSTEAYIRDLEDKIKSHDEISVSSSESLSDLKRELMKYKDTDLYSAKYIADLETRLARSDESIIALQQTVERYENESEARREEVETLQLRLRNLQTDGTSWKSDLEQREIKVRELEQKMLAWEQKKQDAGAERDRLGVVVGSVAAAREGLSSASTDSLSVPSRSESSSPNRMDLSSEHQLLNLQETHTATLADLSSVTAKYRDALREISDLNAQLQEVKAGGISGEDGVENQVISRRLTNRLRAEPSSPELQSNGRKIFFRELSTDSLHSKSQSLSPSLSQEFVGMRRLSTSPNGSLSNSPSRASHHRLHVSVSSPVSPNGERSVFSMEREIMRLQEVLKEREAEITLLENASRDRALTPTASTHTASQDEAGEALSPATVNNFSEIRKGLVNGHTIHSDSPESDPSLLRLNDLMLSMAQKESQHRTVVDTLTEQLAQVQRQHDELTSLSRDQALNMSTELEALRTKRSAELMELEEARKGAKELNLALATAQADHAQFIDSTKAEHAEALRVKGSEVDELIGQLEAKHLIALTDVQSQLQASSNDLGEARRLHEEHATAMGDLREQLSSASAALEKAHKDHEQAFGALNADHATQLKDQADRAKELLENTKLEHESNLAKMLEEHEVAMKAAMDEAASTLHRTEEEYYDVLTKLRGDHAAAIDKKAADAAANLERLKEEHAGELRMAEISREGSLTESQSAQQAVLKSLQDEHSAAILRKEATFTEDIEALNSEHAKALIAKDEDHRSKRENLKAEHSAILSRVRNELEDKLERLKLSLKRSQEDAAAALSAADDSHQKVLNDHRSEHASLLDKVNVDHLSAVAKLNSEHEATIAQLHSAAEKERSEMLQTHTQETLKMRTEHQTALGQASADLVTAQEKHRADLAEAQAQHDRLAAQAKATLAESIAALQQTHDKEVETLRKSHDLVLAQLTDAKALAEASSAENIKFLDAERDSASAALADLHSKHSGHLELQKQALQAVQAELSEHKSVAAKLAANAETSREAHQRSLSDHADLIASVQQELLTSNGHRDKLTEELKNLKTQLDVSNSSVQQLQADKVEAAAETAATHASLTSDLEKQRALMVEMQANLQRVMEEKDVLQAQKSKQEATIREMQARQSFMPSPERNMTYGRSSGLPAMKLPPPTPPPNVPPPPAPKGVNGEAHSSVVSNSSAASSVLRSSTGSSQNSQGDSPTTPGTSITNGHQVSSSVDSKVSVVYEQQRRLDEQDTMIKTLNKQLSHCETDLQAHMDLVSTLETSLGDSEKNLRKARMHATELARERDTLSNQIDTLRTELQDSKREVATVRQSIVDEKQSMESRLEDERRARERVRQQLDSRTEELSKRKNKFACL